MNLRAGLGLRPLSFLSTRMKLVEEPLPSCPDMRVSYGLNADRAAVSGLGDRGSQRCSLAANEFPAYAADLLQKGGTNQIVIAICHQAYLKKRQRLGLRKL